MKLHTLALPAGALTAMLALAGCAPSEPNETLAATEVAFQHIHKLEVSRGDGGLLVASHEGLYRLTETTNGDTTAVGPIGGLDIDLMGFAVADGVTYASGHPGPNTPSRFGAPNLGLITSADGGKSWANVALTGQTDFHALTVMTGGDSQAKVFGIDSRKQRIQLSLDAGKTWIEGAELEARDILAVGQKVYATTRDGLAVSDDGGASFRVDPSAPGLYLLAGDQEGQLVGIDTSGILWSQGGDGTWKKGGAVTGVPQALAVDGDGIYVADKRGIVRTEDVGATWTVLKLSQ